jgi:hypothetical protein
MIKPKASTLQRFARQGCSRSALSLLKCVLSSREKHKGGSNMQRARRRAGLWAGVL